eukprot:SAG31_NODE_1832_length_7148_cov_5.322315_4_plen_78_part_00
MRSVVKAATVPQEKTNNLPPIKGAEEAPDEPAEDVALLHTQIAELRQKLVRGTVLCPVLPLWPLKLRRSEMRCLHAH